MDQQTLHDMNVQAARHANDQTREVFMAGVAAGISITVEAVAAGRATPEWIDGVRNMVALHREHSSV